MNNKINNSLSQGTASYCKLLLYLPRQWYSVNDRQNRNKFMINHNKSVLHLQGIEPRSLDSQSNTLPIDLTRKCNNTSNNRFNINII